MSCSLKRLLSSPSTHRLYQSTILSFTFTVQTGNGRNGDYYFITSIIYNKYKELGYIPFLLRLEKLVDLVRKVIASDPTLCNVWFDSMSSRLC